MQNLDLSTPELIEANKQAIVNMFKESKIRGAISAGLTESAVYTLKSISRESFVTSDNETREYTAVIFEDAEGNLKPISLQQVLSSNLLTAKDETGKLIARQTDFYKHMDKFSRDTITSEASALAFVTNFVGKKYKVAKAVKEEIKYIVKEENATPDFPAGTERTLTAKYYILNRV